MSVWFTQNIDNLYHVYNMTWQSYELGCVKQLKSAEILPPKFVMVYFGCFETPEKSFEFFLVKPSCGQSF